MPLKLHLIQSRSNPVSFLEAALKAVEEAAVSIQPGETVIFNDILITAELKD